MGLRLAPQAGQNPTGAESAASVPPEAIQQSQRALPTIRYFGDYELLEEIARGGMGIVFKARQRKLDRLVAVKLILAGEFASREQALRFRAEVEAAARLQHPNIVRIHETGEHEGQPYFSMDYVEGGNLAALVREKPLPAKRAAAYVKTIAEAIHYAHEQGILHRDLKPSNVLIDANDQPRVTDFGLAKRMQKESFLTETGDIMGSPNFMPPEQAGAKAVKAGRYSDVYSLGGILFYLVTGRPPFVAESVAHTMHHVLNTEPVSPRLLNAGVPQDIATICLKCLEKEPTRRYQTAQQLADELNRFLSDEPIHARPVSRPERLWRWCKRKPALASFSAATALLLLTVLIGSPIVAYRVNQARKAEQVQLQRAEAGELTARRNQYASDMFRAHEAVNEGDLFSALRLLDRNRPTPNQLGSSRRKEAHSLQRASQSLVTSAATDLRGWEWRYLWQQCQGDQLFILGYHSNGVSAVGFLPDGKTAYSAGKDKAVRLWDLESKREIGLLAHDYAVTVAACSPDGRWLATGTQAQQEEGPLRLWNLTTREAVILTTNFWLRRNSIVFSPDSQLLAFVDVYKGVHLWSVPARQEIARFPAYVHFQDALGVAFSPDGRTLACNENETGEIVLWDVYSQSEIKRLKGHKRYVMSLAFTPDGQTLISGSTDKTVKLWDITKGRERNTFTNYGAGVGGLRMSPDGKMLATGGSAGNQRITVQEIPSGKELLQVRGHQNIITDGSFSPDGQKFITGSADGTVRVWDVTASQKNTETLSYPTGLREVWGGNGTALSLSPDGEHLLPVFADRTFSVWATATLSDGERYALPVSGFSCAGLARGGKLAAFVKVDGNIVFWRRETGATNWFARPTTNASTRAVFSADGKRLAIGGIREVCVLDVDHQGKPHSFSISDEDSAQPFDTVMSLAFSADGQKLMAGFFYGLVKVWDLSGRTAEVTLKGHDYQVRGLALLSDGRTLVSVSREVRFWDLNSRQQIASLRPRPTLFHGASLSPDGRRLAVGGGDGLITIWDLASQQEVATLRGHDQSLHSFSFLSDGNTLVSIGLDRLRVWRAASFEEADWKTLKN
jgi:WD40 repeat protein/serine/threonine protein kinase